MLSTNEKEEEQAVRAGKSEAQQMLDVQWSFDWSSAPTAAESADAEHSTCELCPDRDNAD